MEKKTGSKNKGTNNKGSRNARIRRGAENVIMVCLAVIIALSGWKIYSIMHDYNKNEDVYEEIAEKAQKPQEPQGFTGDIDFASLSEINPDVIGWLYYEGTHIDYPVVQGSDNDKYLTTMFDGSYAAFGTLFADAASAEPFRQFNTIVYGHHMKNGSMFGDLKKLKDEAYCHEHPRLELITPEGKYHLDIYAFLNQPSDSEIYVTNISEREDCESYLTMIDEIADYTTGISAGADDRLVILSTCAYEYQNARYMVVCRMVPWDV